MSRKTLSIISSVLAFVAVQSCTVQEAPVFPEDEKYIYFKRYITDDEGNNVRVDTVMMSFSHHYGVTEYTQEFYVGLVGQIPEEDLEYSVQVVTGKDKTTGKEMTTATPDQYSMPEKLVFRKGLLEDTLRITVYKDKIADGDERVLRLRLVESDDLKVAYNSPADSYTDIQFRFNNRIVQPTWWTQTVEKVFFEKFSYEKYVTIIEANEGLAMETIGDMSSAELRKIALNTKDYIKANDIKEADGSPMEIPIN